MQDMRDAGPAAPHVQLVEMATAHWLSRIIFVAARIGLADHLAQEPRSASELAALTETHAPSLYRLMRTLASLGVLKEDESGRFALTRVGEALKSGDPGRARAAILTIASDWWCAGFGNLLFSVQTGKSGFEKALGMPLFDWLAKNPREASLFSETMIGFHGAEPAAVAAAYDFSGLNTIVDVGGATGHLLTTILGRYRDARGILFDLPHVVRDAPALIEARALAGRISVQTGSFFDTVPSAGDAYLLSHILIDWSEDKCLAILGNCRRAMNANARLLVIEMVLPDGNAPHPGKVLDMMMLVGPGGQQRTQNEYDALLRKAGLRLSRVVPTASPVSVIEAVAA